MNEFLHLLAGILNNIHDLIIRVAKIMGFRPTDEQLHFWVIGCIGIVIFIIVDTSFRFLARWSVSVISFITTFIAMVVFVFGIEIEQKITGRGNLEFTDITSGLWGFLAFFSVYFIFRLAIFLIKKLWVSLKVYQWKKI
ncbi:MAG: hypothetical protein A4E53_01795 [Pelotomaculum sp. PtaB.Bin104]|nr:MAG: hypothetical protein A4E53_01795 [Pelotomaculum sp. PtaB.Bin104]